MTDAASLVQNIGIIVISLVFIYFMWRRGK
jgi:hypothetical protein